MRLSVSFVIHCASSDQIDKIIHPLLSERRFDPGHHKSEPTLLSLMPYKEFFADHLYLVVQFCTVLPLRGAHELGWDSCVHLSTVIVEILSNLLL